MKHTIPEKSRKQSSNQLVKHDLGMSISHILEMENLCRVPRSETGGAAPLRAGAGATREEGRPPPFNNMGGKREADSQGVEAGAKRVPEDLFDDGTETIELFAGDRGELIRIRTPKPGASPANSAIVDQVSFTLKIQDVDGPWLGERDCVVCLSEKLVDIFGYGVTGQRVAGLNFYKQAYYLGDSWGHVCIGGQRETVLVQVTGQGCMAAKEGWEKRLYDYLTGKSSARLTRVDVAHDIFNGSYTVNQALEDHKAGKFANRGTPRCEMRGDWINPSGRGRTLYIGTRAGGKMARIYEKGLQLSEGFGLVDGKGLDFEKWVRCEVEFHNKDRVIPFEILLRPGAYLAGAYPAFQHFSEERERIAMKRNSAIIAVETSYAWLRKQAGAYINYLSQLDGLEEFMRKVTEGKDAFPKRLKSAAPSWTASPEPIDFSFAGVLVTKEWEGDNYLCPG